jgi:hypothetical protein
LITKLALDDLTERLEEEWILEWRQLEKIAADERGDALKLYDVGDEAGMLYHSL